MESAATEGQPTTNVQADTPQTSEQTPNPSSETSEKLYAGKYKAPEELEKGYKELESLHGKTVAEKEQQIKEANERYNQLITQITAQQQQAAPQEDIYETPEEKIQKEVGTLKQELTQLKTEKIAEKFLNDNPDLKGKVEQKIAWAAFQEINAAKGRYMPLDQMLKETAEIARKEIAEIKGQAVKEVSETRTELKTHELPKGTSTREPVDTRTDETPKDYITWRNEQADRTRRLV